MGVQGLAPTLVPPTLAPPTSPLPTSVLTASIIAIMTSQAPMMDFLAVLISALDQAPPTLDQAPLKAPLTLDQAPLKAPPTLDQAPRDLRSNPNNKNSKLAYQN